MLLTLLSDLDDYVQSLFMLFEHYPLFKLGLFVILGALLGSHAGMLSVRLPLQIKQESQFVCHNGEKTQCQYSNNDSLTHASNDKALLSKKRSHCLNCMSLIPFYHNVPILSYIVLKGKCANCHAPISKQYLWIEMHMLVLFFCIGLLPQIGYETIAFLAITYFTVILLWIDKKHFLLPDVLTLSLLWMGLFFNLFELFVPLQDAVIGAMVGYASLWGVNKLFCIVRGYDGMGQGDMKYFAAIGACIGTHYLLLILTLSAALAIIHTLLDALFMHKKKLGTNSELESSKQYQLNINGSDNSINNKQMIAFGVYLSISFWGICFYQFLI
ncbi:prepilin peptidase [Thorsellia anophelis]|uniref:Prepilin leader peptidase/N-methyltransferase n=1 Tax=Thorsellia anophelis DSM 18579 TaxID=1123402 RepID=A0A1I0AUQ8_9GAMM|nr:A24 family peptidase [Thorsellia anophelis]SES98120.1 leader peptidase (prepilin peptidase) / N-methyltransferase [Thorsellia anophelis DSM 18579]